MYWQSPLEVFDYLSFRSVRIIHYIIPTQTTRSVWIFNGVFSEAGCEERDIEIALQYGSYPIVTPNNETFPPDFNMQRTEPNFVHLRTNGTRTFLSITHPLSGSWFAAVYLYGRKTIKFKQKGLSKECKYYVGSMHKVVVREDIAELPVGVPTPLNMTSNSTIQYRFQSTELTWQYQITFTNCSFTPYKNANATGNETYADCPLLAAVRGRALAGWDESSTTVNCSEKWETGSCSLIITSPYTNTKQFMNLWLDSVGIVDFIVHIDLIECKRFGSQSSRAETVSTNVTQGDIVDNITLIGLQFPDGLSRTDDGSISILNITDDDSLMSPGLKDERDTSISQLLYIHANSSEQTNFNSCTRIPTLGRYQRAAFDVQYSLRLGLIPFPNQLLIPSDEPLILAFDVIPGHDSGGTLKYQLDIIKDRIENLYTNVEVVSCIQQGRIPFDEDGVYCEPENRMILDFNNVTSRRIYFPYPESGTWYISLLARCLENTTSWIPCQKVLDSAVGFVLAISPCVDGMCGVHGSCREYFSGVLHFSACACIAEWRGYGCTDGSVAESDALQLLSTLLLTLSNLSFIPAIVVAIHRRFFVEALIYSYTMFFSTFYHACDGDSRHIWCMMPYNVLAHCDFFGSIYSFWVTLIAMARLPEQVRSLLLVIAALALAMGVQWDRHSLWTFLIPVGTGLIVLVFSWSFRCYRRKECYPSKRRWLLFITPGMVFALMGLIIFAFFETSRNYKYTHSMWHACMALSIVFFLPPDGIPLDKEGPWWSSARKQNEDEGGLLRDRNRSGVVNKAFEFDDTTLSTLPYTSTHL